MLEMSIFISDPIPPQSVRRFRKRQVQLTLGVFAFRAKTDLN